MWNHRQHNPIMIFPSAAQLFFFFFPDNAKNFVIIHFLPLREPVCNYTVQMQQFWLLFKYMQLHGIKMYLMLITQHCHGTHDCFYGEYEMCRCHRPDLYVRVVSIPVCNFAQPFCQRDALDILMPTLQTLYNEVMKSTLELIWGKQCIFITCVYWGGFLFYIMFDYRVFYIILCTIHWILFVCFTYSSFLLCFF